MRRAWRWTRLLLRNLAIHFFWGTICLVRRKHLKSGIIGKITNDRRGGFRPVTTFQCAKCMAIFVSDADAKRLGARLP